MWQPIESADKHEIAMFVPDDGTTISVAHYDRDQGEWMLGSYGDWADQYLRYTPRFWLPSSFEGNPFDLPSPGKR